MQIEWRYAIDGRDKSSGEIITEIFENRGFNIDEFLRPKEEDIFDSERLHNIEKAYDILMRGIAEGKSLTIWADTDLDGVSSAAIMYKYLKGMTDKVDVYINEGKEHGVKGYNDINIESDIIITEPCDGRFRGIGLQGLEHEKDQLPSRLHYRRIFRCNDCGSCRSK